MHTIEAKNLSKTFKISEAQRRSQDLPDRKKVAVSDISFTANAGEIFGLLGPNGAGKTTTMRMLATLIKPDTGDVLYDGVSIKDKPVEIKSRFAFLTTDLQLDKKSTANDMFDYFAGLQGLREVSVEHLPRCLPYPLYLRDPDRFCGVLPEPCDPGIQ